MTNSLESKMGDVSLNDSPTYERTPYGKEMLKHFLFGPEFRSLNHGAFGTYPQVVREKQRAIQDQLESAPDQFIRDKYPKLLDESRAVVAKVLNAPVETVVFVPNATTGVNTILQNLVWHEDGKDEILYFNTIYGACGKTIEYVSEISHNMVQPRKITLTYPLSDSSLVSVFKEAIRASRAARKIPRVAVFDTVSSLPGLRMPFEALTKVCKEEGILSLVDGAHGIGHLPIDLSTLEPDFFTSNVHKWLFVPRGCAVLYVPIRNQALIRSSMPTSHSFQSYGDTRRLLNLLGEDVKGGYEALFEFSGTIDSTNYLVVAEALKWREEVCGGEQAIMEYNSNLAREGGKAAAKILGTKILDNDENTLTECCLVNVLLPLSVGASDDANFSPIKPEHQDAILPWIHHILMEEYKTFVAIFFFQGQWWGRLSGQVYLELEDFEWIGQVLKEVCDRAGNGEFLK